LNYHLAHDTVETHHLNPSAPGPGSSGRQAAPSAAVLGNLVAPKNIRREKSEGDEYLRETYGGERGPPFNKSFDPSADEV
jgi:hypothetical protein